MAPLFMSINGGFSVYYFDVFQCTAAVTWDGLHLGLVVARTPAEALAIAQSYLGSHVYVKLRV